MDFISDNQTSVAQRIIEHLKLKNYRGDDLDGITIAIYDQEMKVLSRQIVKDLAELITEGIISETMDQDGKRRYKLVKNPL